MTVYYLDSSAWVKHFLDEPGSSWVCGLFEQRAERQDCLLASASLGYVEVAAALMRQQEARKLDTKAVDQAIATLQINWHAFFQVELTNEIADFAFSIARNWRLRGADAMHLAAAGYLRQRFGRSDVSIVLVASDEELLAAAQASGFEVINPVLEQSTG